MKRNIAELTGSLRFLVELRDGQYLLIKKMGEIFILKLKLITIFILN